MAGTSRIPLQRLKNNFKYHSRVESFIILCEDGSHLGTVLVPGARIGVQLLTEMEETKIASSIFWNFRKLTVCRSNTTVKHGADHRRITLYIFLCALC